MLSNPQHLRKVTGDDAEMLKGHIRMFHELLSQPRSDAELADLAEPMVTAMLRYRFMLYSEALPGTRRAARPHDLFNEFVKLENANEKVIVSPPQIEPANVRADGKHVKITLYDTLRENTTYTIDFSDAIEDNNEGNPMGQYTFSFSTGESIDTMEVAGTVLNAQDLEPIKGILVGLYPADSTFSDTLLTSTPFHRVSRTNGSGRFSIKGVKPGRYRTFALKDVDGNFVFNQKSEVVAFDTTVIETSSKPDVRMDTIWRDSTHYDSIREIPNPQSPYICPI